MALDFNCSLSKPKRQENGYFTVQTYTEYTPQSHLYCNVCLTYRDMYCLYSSLINISTVWWRTQTTGLFTASENNKKTSLSDLNVHLEPQKMLTMRKNKILKYSTYRRHKELTWIRFQTHWIRYCSVKTSSHTLSILFWDLSTLHTLKTSNI